jgi:FKBP-type peptidyl-prolyl cis-trans isomerase
MKGFRDSFKETSPLLSDEEIQDVFAQVQQQMQEKQQAAAKKLQTNWEETFAEAKKPQGGAKTTKSGLKYEVYAEGKGPKPKPTDTVVVHYIGELPDGKVFDSSVARGEPAVFPVGGVIKGWTEGLQLMSVGSKYKFYIPADLAYGKEGRPPRIPSNQDLVFEVELLDIMAGDGPPAEE